MAEQKTKPTPLSVERFINGITDEQVRDDCQTLVTLMKKITGAEPVMWGSAIVGFGKYHYRYESGHEGDSCLTGFSPRKQNLSLYVMPGLEIHAELLEKLGRHKAGKGCLYVKRLSDIDIKILEKLISASVKHLRELYPQQ